MKVLVLGHSFIRRLREWMECNGRELSFETLDVHLHGVGGRTIEQTFYQDMGVVGSLRPDIVFLQVGGNDISDNNSPTDILVSLKRLVTVLLDQYHVSKVIVGSIFCRNRPRNLTAKVYDRKKKKVNRFLSKKFGAFEQGKKVFFFTHKFFKEEYFRRDGVHLNDVGNRYFYNSIRAALRLTLAN